MNLDIATLKMASLLIFFGLFAAVLLRLVLTRSEVFRRAARLPLEDDPPSPGRAPDGGVR